MKISKSVGPSRSDTGVLFRMVERRGNCWSTAGQRHASFKDDPEELGGSALPPAQKLTLMMSSL